MSPAGRRRRAGPSVGEFGARSSPMLGPAVGSRFTRLRFWVAGLNSNSNAAHEVAWPFTAAQPSGARVGEPLRS